MRRWVMASGLAMLVAVLATGAAAADSLIIEGGRLFDGVSGTRVRHRATLITGGRLQQVNVPVGTIAREGIPVLELANDDTILPGFFDLHAHYNLTLHEKRREEMRVMPVLYLANGATSTFPAGSFDPEGMLQMRRRIDRGEQIGPRVWSAGPYFGPARPGWNADATDDEIRAEVDYWAERGVAGFKAKRISARHLAVLVERAHRHGLTVTGHLDSGFNNTVNPRDAILLGIDRVEHFLGGDALPAERPAYDSFEANVRPGTPEFERIVELFLEHRVHFDATVTAYGYFGDRELAFDYWTDERRFFTPYARELTAGRRQQIERFGNIHEIKLATLEAFYDAGGGDLITLGTDHNSAGEYLPGFSVHRELHAFVLAGIPPADALRMATINGARALNLGDRFGTVETGKWADLIVVPGNPLKDITVTRGVHTVIKGGVVYRTDELLASVEDALGPRNEEELGEW
jgi:imidazolonepropionase-like amidohydrolase